MANQNVPCEFNLMHSNKPGHGTYVCWTHRTVTVDWDQRWTLKTCEDAGKPAVPGSLDPISTWRK